MSNLNEFLAEKAAALKQMVTDATADPKPLDRSVWVEVRGQREEVFGSSRSDNSS